MERTRLRHPATPAAPAPVRGPGRRRRSRCALLACGIALAACALGRCQEIAGGPAGESIGEVAPELFYMEDDSGRLVPVPGFRYRDFMDLLRMKEGLAGPLQPPAAILENVVLRIDARNVRASAGMEDERSAVTCPVRVECTVRQGRGGWAMVPLELGGLLLSEPPRHEGPGRIMLDATVDRAGYRGWFDAAPQPGADVRHTIILEGRLPIEATTIHESFDIRLPVALTSRLEVQSARRTPAVHVQPHVAEETITPAPDGAGSTVSIAGPSGPVRIRIADAREDRETRGVAAEVMTESTVRIDGRNAVTEATIRLANLEPGTSRLRVALPPRTTLREVRAPASVVDRGGTPDAPTVDLAVDVGSDGRAAVELACERAVDPSGGTPFESLGFTVEGIAAWRQWGRASLIVDGDWRVTWNDATELRRVDPPANVRQQGFVAAFAYDAQPASLPLQVLPLRSRVVIEPEYRYDVGGTRVTLDARFRVAARGAPVSSIAFAIDPAWSIDEVGPAGAVDVAAVTAEAGEIVIPFAQALAGDTVVEVRASRAIRKEDERVAWKLPVPRADLVGPAVVVIASQTDIELLPANDGIIGLVRQTAAAVPLVDADRTAMVYRLDASEGSFAAARRFLPRRVEATVLAQATLDAAEIVIEETIRLNVLHVPLEFLELLVPDTVAATGSFEVRQDDELLDPSEVPAAGDDARDDAVPVTRMRAILPTPLLGGGDVTVRFRLPTPTIPPESTVALDLPLALPVGANVSRQTVTISAPESLAVAVRGDAWRRDVGPAGGPRQAWSAPQSPSEFPLALSARRTDPARTMVVEAAWLQTRLLPGVREDIRRYVISAAADRIVVSLPEPAAAVAGGSGEAAGGMAGCEVLLDGETVPAAVRAGGRVVVDLPQVDPARRWRLDIRTTTPRDRGWAGLAARFGLPGPVRLEAPVFESPVLERRFYWTIHARPDEHLLGLPSDWTSQQQWRPAALGWRLVPVASSHELAGWIAAVAAGDRAATAGGHAPAVALPPLAESTFVYAGVGSPGAAAPWILPTWFVVLVASGATLACGLGLVYRPELRRWQLAALAAIGLAAAAAPDAAPLAGQAALPGAALAALAWGLHAFARRVPGRGADNGPPAGAPASSMTRQAVGIPSLIVSPAIDDAPTATHARTP